MTRMGKAAVTVPLERRVQGVTRTLCKNLGQGCSCVGKTAGSQPQRKPDFYPKQQCFVPAPAESEMLQACKHCVSEEQLDMKK